MYDEIDVSPGHSSKVFQKELVSPIELNLSLVSNQPNLG